MEKNILSAILIDDESSAITNLTSLIETYCPSLHIIGNAERVSDGIQIVNKLKPDVIFLDINMPEQNGFDLIKQITHLPSVVFVTSHEKYALQAMKVCAVDFLLKPICIDELEQTEAKLIQIHRIKPEIRKNYSHVLRNLYSYMDNFESIRKITIHGNDGYEIFDIDDIIYLRAEANYTSFHFTKQKEFIISKTLKEYEEILAPFGFMRIHKSTLVNLIHIKKIKQNDTVCLLMTNGETLDVSRRRISVLLDWAKAQINSFS